MFGPRRGSSVVGLVVFIVFWLAALAVVILGHNRLTGLSQEAKAKSLEEEMKKKKFDPQKETENVEELFHRRDTLRKEVALLGRQLGFGLDKAQVLEEAQFTTALNNAVDKLKEFQGATVREGLPKFETQKNPMSAGNLYDEEIKMGTNFFTKFDNLLVMLTERLVRYEDALSYYVALKEMAEDTASRYTKAESIVKSGLTRGDSAWQSAPEAAMDVPGKESYNTKINELKTALEKTFLVDKSMGGQARTIEDAEARAVAQMTDYVIGTVDRKIAEYEGLITAEETKIDEARRMVDPAHAPSPGVFDLQPGIPGAGQSGIAHPQGMGSPDRAHPAPGLPGRLADGAPGCPGRRVPRGSPVPPFVAVSGPVHCVGASR